MNTLKQYGLGGVALLIAIFALFAHSTTTIVKPSQAPLGGVTNYDSLGLGPTPSYTEYAVASPINTSLGVVNPNTGQTMLVGTTTMFAVANPATATSSCVVDLYGTYASTTGSIFVGTSTSLGLPFAQTAAALISTSSIGTSTQFWLRSGNTASAGGSSGAAGGSVSVTVAPGENIVGVATTTTTLNIGITGTATSTNSGTTGVVGSYAIQCSR